MQNKFKLYILFLLCFLHSFVYAEDTTRKQIDSLKKIVNSYVHDSIKVKAYFEWDYLIYIEDIELDFVLNQKILTISIANIERLSNTNKDTNELIFFNYSLVRAYNNQGLYYIEKNKPYDALVLFEKGFKITSEYNFPDLLSFITNNIGLIYDFINDYNNALEYYLKSIQFENDSLSSAPAFNNIGLCYFKLGNIEKAKTYYFKSLHFSLLANELKNLGNTYSNLSDLYSFEKNQDSALFYLSKASETFTLTSNQQGLSYLNGKLGEFYLSKKDFTNSILYCRKSLSTALEFDFLSISSSSCKCLYQSFKELKKIDSAFYYLEKYIEEGEKYTLEKSNSDLLS